MKHKFWQLTEKFCYYIFNNYLNIQNIIIFCGVNSFFLHLIEFL